VAALHRRQLKLIGPDKPKRKPKTDATPDTSTTEDQGGSGGME